MTAEAIFAAVRDRDTERVRALLDGDPVLAAARDGGGLPLTLYALYRRHTGAPRGCSARPGRCATRPHADRSIFGISLALPWQCTKRRHAGNPPVTWAAYHECRRRFMDGPTRGQIVAVYEVMRLLREDDRERGLEDDAVIRCDACRRDRPAAGSVRYDALTLCNGCATDYELLRLAHLTPPLSAPAPAGSDGAVSETTRPHGGAAPA